MTADDRKLLDELQRESNPKYSEMLQEQQQMREDVIRAKHITSFYAAIRVAEKSARDKQHRGRK
jgi:hypothetical protein